MSEFFIIKKISAICPFHKEFANEAGYPEAVLFDKFLRILPLQQFDKELVLKIYESKHEDKTLSIVQLVKEDKKLIIEPSGLKKCEVLYNGNILAIIGRKKFLFDPSGKKIKELGKPILFFDKKKSSYVPLQPF